MAAVTETLDTVRDITGSGYKYGFETVLEMDLAPKGLNADIIRLISARKQEPEWLLEWRLRAYRAWLTQEDPQAWAKVRLTFRRSENPSSSPPNRFGTIILITPASTSMSIVIGSS